MRYEKCDADAVENDADNPLVVAIGFVVFAAMFILPMVFARSCGG